MRAPLFTHEYSSVFLLVYDDESELGRSGVDYREKM